MIGFFQKCGVLRHLFLLSKAVKEDTEVKIGCSIFNYNRKKSLVLVASRKI